MAKLSLREITQSQLDATPIVDGQLVLCTDTGNMYRDTANIRVRTGQDIEFVAELPLAPISGKIYALHNGEMWAYENGNWTSLNPEPERITNTQIDEILKL